METNNLAILSEPLRDLRSLFAAYVDVHRPALWRYCLRLTQSAWDAEDLVQETLTKAFAHLPNFWHRLDARAYLFRIATNTWIDHLRRSRYELDAFDDERHAPADTPVDPLEIEEAIRRLLVFLPPRQRVVFLLTQALDFRAGEVAAMLHTTEGAVKATLHRARTTLKEHAAHPAPPAGDGASPAVTPSVVQTYVTLFNRRDATGIAALLDEHVAVEIVGVGEEHGRAEVEAASLAEWAADPRPQWMETGTFEGRPVGLVYYGRPGGERTLGWVTTLEIAGDRIVRQRIYYFCPELLQQVAAAVGVPASNHGYHYVPTEGV